jgi:hypothetical protein
MQSQRSLSAHVRQMGDQLTGGGLRALSKRIVARSARRLMNNPIVLAAGRTLLKPFPELTTRLYKIATSPDPRAIAAAIEASHKHSSAGLIASGEFSPSARIAYQRLHAAIANSDVWNRKS